MASRLVASLCVLSFLVVAASALAQSDPLSGTWTGDWGPSARDRNQVTVALKWDGKALTGTVNPGPEAVQLEKASYDAKTGAVRMEARVAAQGTTFHYVIEGKLDKNVMSGSWNHDNRKGDFKITKQ